MKNNLESMEHASIKEFTQYTIDKLNDLKESSIYGCDLHNEVFNTDYFIIGRYQAEQWLINHIGVFNAISAIFEYEKSNFGEVNTYLGEAEKVCNMFVYIIGEELLQESNHLTNECWDDHLDPADFEKIIEELKEYANID